MAHDVPFHFTWNAVAPGRTEFNPTLSLGDTTMERYGASARLRSRATREFEPTATQSDTLSERASGRTKCYPIDRCPLLHAPQPAWAVLGVGLGEHRNPSRRRLGRSASLVTSQDMLVQDRDATARSSAGRCWALLTELHSVRSSLA